MERNLKTHRSKRITMIEGCVVALLVGTASGEITSVGGDVQLITPPLPPAQDGVMWAFNEQQNVTLAADLEVDATQPGLYDENSDLIQAVIPAGVKVNSHYVHSDQEGLSGPDLNGSVTFENMILGVIVNDGNLHASDTLGAPNTQYPGFLSDRGPELGILSSDWFSISPDRRTVTMHANTGLGVDDWRVVTTAPIPAPGVLAIVGAAGLCAVRHRR